MKNLRVLLVSPLGEIGGGEKVFLSLAKHLPKWQVEPILACMRPGSLVELARKQGLRAYEFKNHRYRQIAVVWEGIQWLSNVVRETEADLIHANHASHVYSGLASRLANTPEVWHLHDYPYKWSWLDRFLRKIPTNHVIFTTYKVKTGYPRFHTHPHSVIPPCCIEPDYLRTFAPQSDIRAKYNLPPGPLLLTVTRLQEHKGHRYLIDAVPTVLKSHPDAIFVVVGKPSDNEQKKYTEALLVQSKQLDVQNQVKFLGYVGDEDLVSLYREASALIHPAITEGFGLVLVEAMVLGTPVIAAAADGPSELITDGQTGLLVPTRDSDSLAQAIIRLLNRPDLAKILSKNSMAAAEQLSVEKMIEETVNIYRSLVI